MTPRDHDRLLKYYQDSYKIFGDHDARSIHWSDEKNQQIRFLILSQIADLNGQSVLDVGCGLGDFYKFFLSSHIDVDYTGIDIVPYFINTARKRFPEIKVAQKDIFSVNEKYDYVLASGALSFKVENNDAYYLSMIKKMYDCARLGLAFNMLNRARHVDNETFAAYDLQDISNQCKQFCSRVEIVVDYLPQDFTIYLYK